MLSINGVQNPILNYGGSPQKRPAYSAIGGTIISATIALSSAKSKQLKL